MAARRRWEPAVVRSATQVAEDVRAIEIEPEGGAVRYAPGSHLNVTVDCDGRADTRSYSLVGSEPRDGAYRVGVKRLPTSRGGSAYMWQLQPGDRVAITPPQNLFALSYGSPEYLLVAGGIGVTPLVGMAQVLARRGDPVRMCYGVRRASQLAFADELEAALGSALTTHASSQGDRLDLEAEVAALHPDGELYLCGPASLIEEARRVWHEADRPPARLRFETFASSGRFDPEPFDVHVADHDLLVRVERDQSMLEALQAAGVAMISDCLRGDCGLCAVDVLEVDGELDHRDVFLSEAQRLEGARMCTCVSRVAGGGVTVDTGYRPGTRRGQR